MLVLWLMIFYQHLNHKNPLKDLGIDVEFKMKPVIGGIIKNGPADKSDLKANDVIVKIGNTKINYASDIRNTIFNSKPNSFLMYIEKRFASSSCKNWLIH